MENPIFLHSTPIKELRQIFSDLLDEKLQQHKTEEPQQPGNNEFLTRRNVCDLLKISLATLHYYTKDGILQGYRIGGRVLYKSEEVKNAVQSIQSLKYKHR